MEEWREQASVLFFLGFPRRRKSFVFAQCYGGFVRGGG